MGWLRTTLAQRHVDHYRRRRREEPLDDVDAAAHESEILRPRAELTQLENAVVAALGGIEVDERFLLASYYLDGRTLAQIAGVLRVHEATVSRKLRRATSATSR